MLVLNRKENEALSIGDDVRVVVQRIAGNRVSLAIDAPRMVPIVREELYPINNKQVASFSVPLPLDIAEQVRAEASLRGIPQEQYLSLLVGVGLLHRVSDED